MQPNRPQPRRPIQGPRGTPHQRRPAGRHQTFPQQKRTSGTTIVAIAGAIAVCVAVAVGVTFLVVSQPQSNAGGNREVNAGMTDAQVAEYNKDIEAILNAQEKQNAKGLGNDFARDMRRNWELVEADVRPELQKIWLANEHLASVDRRRLLANRLTEHYVKLIEDHEANQSNQQQK